LISAWSEENARPQTAISFAQGAAMILPRDPKHACEVGRLCRTYAQYERAETWYRRARVLAWRARDHSTLALCWIGLGNIHVQRGNFEEARASHLRALRIARRKGFWHIKPMALHHLFAIAVERHQVLEAERLARQAFRAYSTGNPRFVILAHDVASFWMYQGYFRRALLVFQAVHKLIRRPTERLVALANLARSSGGAGEAKLFEQAWHAVTLAVVRNPQTERACAAMLNLAYGAALLGDWQRARSAARQAYDLARKRGEKEVCIQAEALLRAAEEQRFTLPISGERVDPSILEAADFLAQSFVRRLAGRTG
jgi:tetratricopeptide (TPR) repeat protein